MNQYALDNVSKPQPTGWEGTGYGGLPGAPDVRQSSISTPFTKSDTNEIYPTTCIRPSYGRNEEDSLYDTINKDLYKNLNKDLYKNIGKN